MDSQIKQRLVGALILAALATIFWPIIFVGPEVNPPQPVAATPDPPPVDLSPLPEPDDVGLRSTRQSRSERPRPAEASEKLEQAFADNPPVLPQRDEAVPPESVDEIRETLKKPALDADGLPIAFSLQVAALSSETRAEKLRDDLVEAGYKGYISREKGTNRTLYMVMVGPKFRREELVRVKRVIDDTWSVNSIIVRYLP
ncbi:MAG: SPOR domain-containing protein [Pseudomonadota bacterium]